MPFAPEQILEMANAYGAIKGKEDRLLMALVSRKFGNSTAREFAHHGAARRLRMMTACIRNVFSALPPEKAEIPPREAIEEATINLQAFIINVAGYLDNLAWVWVHERAIRNSDGTALKRTQITLANRAVTRSFSSQFRTYLKANKSWVENLRTFRDSLSHRIPLYIAPHLVLEKNIDAYQGLEKRRLAAKSIAEADALEAEQMKFAFYKPQIRHSVYEPGGYAIVFHPQIIADFNTVEELTNKFLSELDARFDAPTLNGHAIGRFFKKILKAGATWLHRLADRLV